MHHKRNSIRRNLRSKILFKSSFNEKDGSITTWDKPGDIPLDEEDQCELLLVVDPTPRILKKFSAEVHEDKDQILLEDDGRDYLDEDDEVFALQGLESSSEDGEDEGAEEDENLKLVHLRLRKRKGVPVSKEDSSPDQSSDDEEEELGWGKKSDYYSSNVKQIDSEDEEANELEEGEAKRLQYKARNMMSDEDFGIEDMNIIAGQEPTDPTLMEPEVASFQEDKKSFIQKLYKTHPETVALADEYDDLAHNIVKTEARLLNLGENNAADTPSDIDGMFHLYYQAQLTYAALVAFYLYLRAGKKYASSPDLLASHPIMERLLVLKRSLTTIESLDLDVSEGSVASGNDFSLESEDFELLVNERVSLLGDEDSISQSSILHQNKKPGSGSTKMSRNSKKKSSNGTDGIIRPFSELQEPVFKQSVKPSRTTPSISNVFGEATSLDYVDKVDKGARRKTLQFHTSKIESTNIRRQGARKAVAGDDDLPYPERKRKATEKSQNILGQGGDDLDGLDPEPRQATKKRDFQDLQESSEIEDEDNYYDLVHRSKKLKKEQKKAEYVIEREATRSHYTEGAVSGQRSISRAILANKGLTPHRAKSVRNPRVKKRKKFDKAKKKLSSQKSIYKGGIGNAGSYEGERSGITKIAKGIRF